MRRVIGVWDVFLGIGLVLFAILGFMAGVYSYFAVGILLLGIMLIGSGWLIIKGRNK